MLFIIIGIIIGAIWLVFYLTELVADLIVWIVGIGAVALTIFIADQLRLSDPQTCLTAAIVGVIAGIILMPIMPYTSTFGKRFSKKIIKKTEKERAKNIVDKFLGDE